MSWSSCFLPSGDSFGKRSSFVRRAPHCGQLQSSQTASQSFFMFGLLVVVVVVVVLLLLLLPFVPAESTTASRICSVIVMCWTMHSEHVSGSCAQLSSFGKQGCLRLVSLIDVQIMHSRRPFVSFAEDVLLSTGRETAFLSWAVLVLDRGLLTLSVGVVDLVDLVGFREDFAVISNPTVPGA